MISRRLGWRRDHKMARIWRSLHVEIV